jgi:hypothetical protein
VRRDEQRSLGQQQDPVLRAGQSGPALGRSDVGIDFDPRYPRVAAAICSTTRRSAGSEPITRKT